MPLKRYLISLIIIISLFFLIGAKPAKKNKKVESPFEKLKREYITYKHTENEIRESKLKEFYAKFENIYENGSEKDRLASFYFCADIMEKLFEVTGGEQYLEKAIDIYRKISVNNNSYGVAARKKLELYGFYKKNRAHVENENKQTTKAIEPYSPQTKLISIKKENNGNYTRLILELSNNAVFEHRFLREDIEANKPKRIVVDVHNAVLSEGISQNIPVSDKYVDKIRVGQFTKDVARIVIDIIKLESYKVYLLENPVRIVVDVFGEEIKKNVKNNPDETPNLLNTKNYNITVQ
jgi:hypothetical protein